MSNPSYDVEESVIRANSPIPLYSIEGDDKKRIKVACRVPCADFADHWILEFASRVQERIRVINRLSVAIEKKGNELINAIGTEEEPSFVAQLEALEDRQREASKEYLDAVREALAIIDPEVFTTDVLAASSAPQLLGAYGKLYELTDPMQAGRVVTLQRSQKIGISQ